MRFACQEGLIPGNSFAEKLAKLQSYGFEGVELNGGRLMDEAGLAERRSALRDSPVRASSICGGFPAELVHPDPARRRKSIDAVKRLIEIAGEFGAAGVIAVPIFNHNDRLPDLSPLRTRHQLEIELLTEVLREVGAHGEQHSTALLLEPLNRYESNALKDVAEAASVCQALGSRAVQVMPDFFHMNIEEPHIPEALVAVGPYIGHVHLADSTRKEPGSGSTDFRAGFAALKKVGFDGFGALECGLTGPADEALPRCVAYLRECLATA
jgi:sugar phosphate isomerase/epimerase